MDDDQLDIIKRVNKSGADFSIKSPEDPADRAQRHRMEMVLTLTKFIFMLAILAIATHMALHANDAEVRKGSITLMSGVLGFMAGRGSK